MIEFNNQNEHMVICAWLLQNGYVEAYKDFFNISIKENGSSKI